MVEDKPAESFFWRNYEKYLELRYKYRTSRAYLILWMAVAGGLILAGGAPWFLTVIEWISVQLAKVIPIEPITFASKADTVMRYGGFGLTVLAVLGVIIIALNKGPKTKDKFDFTIPDCPITFAQIAAIIGNNVGKAIVLENFTDGQKNQFMTHGALEGDNHIEVLKVLRDRAKVRDAIPPYDVIPDNARIIIRPRRQH